ncbi:MAG: ABC transporter permease [Colwellia sp.]
MTWERLLRSELKAIFSNAPIMMTVFLGVLVYSYLYPLPYSQQTPKEQSFAVVDLDNSQMSRKLARMVDATPQVNIKRKAQNIDQAKALLIDGAISGFMVIPRNFYKEMVLDKSPTIAIAADASYFLIYGTLLEGVIKSAGTLSTTKKVSRAVIAGENMQHKIKTYSPIRLNMKPTFNASLSYVNYVVPAVFILILHQTLLIAMGLLTAGQFEQEMQSKLQAQKSGLACYWLTFPAWKILFVRASIMVIIYSFLFMYYAGFSFEHYHINRLAHIADLFTLLLPFLLSVIFLGVIIGALIPRKELATVVVLLSSLPLVFSAGFIWPVSNMPTSINILANFFPSTSAIQAFLKVNQMGASFESIRGLWMQLWGLTCLFGLGALLLMQAKQKKLLIQSTT